MRLIRKINNIKLSLYCYVKIFFTLFYFNCQELYKTVVLIKNLYNLKKNLFVHYKYILIVPFDEILI